MIIILIIVMIIVMIIILIITTIIIMIIILINRKMDTCGKENTVCAVVECCPGFVCQPFEGEGD